MSIVDNKVLDPKLAADVNEDLQPTKTRIMGSLSYTASFLGGCVSIGTFSMGSALIGVLTITQAILAMAIGCLVIAIALVLIEILWGINNLPVVFGLFTLLQVALAIKGFHGIKWLENFSCVFIVVILAYMLYVVKTKFAVDISASFAGVKGTWGMPFWAATTSFLGIYSTIIINASDYSRNLKENIKPVKTGSIYTIAILPVTLFMGLIGLLVTAATGNSDPVVVFSTTMGSKLLTVVTLVFIAFAQVTTNVLNNIVPPAYVLMESFKMKWSHATVLVGILSVCVMPWKLVTADSAAGLSLFTKVYSAFLGPIFAVMVVDYYLLRKSTLDVNALYDKLGPFRGVNGAAIISIAAGALVSVFVVDLSWYVSLIPTGVVYYLLMKYLPASGNFRIGTIFED